MPRSKIFAYFKLKDGSSGIVKFDTMEQAMKAWEERLQHIKEVFFIQERRPGIIHIF